MAQDTYEVIVIGAGFAGLTAATELKRKGIDVLVLEASSRVGGRVLSATTKLGSHIDLGGQWIGHGHNRIAMLTANAKGDTYKMFTRGLPRIVHEGRTLSLLSPSVLLAILYLIVLELASRIYVPQRWINVTVGKSLSLLPSLTSRRLVGLLISLTSTAELDKFSIFAFAKTVSLSGGLIAMSGPHGGAQDSLVVDSMDIVTQMLSRELRIITDSPVTSISQGRDGVTVTARRKFFAKKAIVTVPPPMLDLTFDPPMPERKILAKTTCMGIVYKALAIFEEPFWREGKGGEFLVLDDPAFGVFDSTSPGGSGHLCLLVTGPPARQLDRLDEDSRRELLLSQLVPHLGQQVLKPMDWHEKAWHLDEYCGGGYLAYPIVGTGDGLLPMPHEHVGNVHWAGTETAQEHPGYIEGAVQSGERAATEVARTLGK